MTGKQNAPEIRFEGFTDPWEQRKLGEMVDRYKELVPTPRNGYVRMGVRSHAKGTFLTEVEPGQQIEEQELSKVKADNLVVNIVFAWEHAVAITSADDAKALVSHRFPQFSFHDDMEPGFFRYAILDEAFRWHLWLASPSGAGRNKTLNVGTMLEYEFSVPKKAEQAKIAAFFDRLDDLITLHQRKYDKLCTVKKSMLDKMFPKPGETEPEIRFEGFTDPWEQRKLSEVATFGGGHTPSMADSDNYEDGCVLWVTSQDVKSSYLDKTTTQITEKGAKELTLYPAGSLVMVTRSGILRHTLPVAELRKPSTVNQDIRVILPQGACCGEWLLRFFISRNKELLLEFGKTGTTVESIDFGKIKDMLLRMPSSVEQQQIGRFFAKLDDLITLHQRKLELLRNIKKSLLDRMFV